MMRESSLRFLVYFIFLTAAGMFAYFANGVQQNSFTKFDQTIIDAVQGLEASWLTKIMKIFTTIGSSQVVVVVTLIFLSVLTLFKRRQEALLLFIVVAGTGALNTVLKYIFKRERPDSHRLVDVGGYSFPSGHTMMAFSLYAILAFILWRAMKSASSRAVLVSFAAFMFIMIASSRIYLGVHYPSDVAGGMSASALLVILSIVLFQRHVKKQGSRLEFHSRSPD